MGKFRKIETPLKDGYILEPIVFEDHREFFMESYYFREV
jgi:dTDP-4-dehydrorhamnose 3,5-epimerase